MLHDWFDQLPEDRIPKEAKQQALDNIKRFAKSSPLSKLVYLVMA
jgi:hypothetical protein